MNNPDKKLAPANKTGAGFMARLDFYQCESSYQCIKACPENAITQGPERLPRNMCHSIEMLPGKPEIDPVKCTGCGDCISACPHNALEMVARI
jgi:NAD-dependent dihydropyrimidine dehydrogenase PreA subunit